MPRPRLAPKVFTKRTKRGVPAFAVVASTVDGLVAIMLTTDAGRTQVLTSFIAAGAVVLFWPVVRKRLGRAPEPEVVSIESA